MSNDVLNNGVFYDITTMSLLLQVERHKKVKTWFIRRANVAPRQTFFSVGSTQARHFDLCVEPAEFSQTVYMSPVMKMRQLNCVLKYGGEKEFFCNLYTE